MKQRNLNQLHTTMQISGKTNFVSYIVLWMFGKHIFSIDLTECHFRKEWITGAVGYFTDLYSIVYNLFMFFSSICKTYILLFCLLSISISSVFSSNNVVSQSIPRIELHRTQHAPAEFKSLDT